MINCDLSSSVITTAFFIFDGFLIDSRGFTPYYYDLDVSAKNAQYKLFRHSCQEGHCLSHLYTEKPRPPGTMQLRTRGHKFQLPTI